MNIFSNRGSRSSKPTGRGAGFRIIIARRCRRGLIEKYLLTYRTSATFLLITYNMLAGHRKTCTFIVMLSARVSRGCRGSRGADEEGANLLRIIISTSYSNTTVQITGSSIRKRIRNNTSPKKNNINCIVESTFNQCPYIGRCDVLYTPPPSTRRQEMHNYNQ